MDPDDQHSSSVSDAAQGAEPPWDLIVDRVDALAAAWDGSLENQSAPPALGALVAGMDDATARHVLLELVKLDLERRWQHQIDPKDIERYCEELPQLGPLDKLPVDVIYEELQARMLVGQQLYQEEISQRFPEQAGALLRLLGGMALSGSPTATYFADTIVEPKKDRPVPTKTTPVRRTPRDAK